MELQHAGGASARRAAVFVEGAGGAAAGVPVVAPAGQGYVLSSEDSMDGAVQQHRAR